MPADFVASHPSARGTGGRLSREALNAQAACAERQRLCPETGRACATIRMFGGAAMNLKKLNS